MSSDVYRPPVPMDLSAADPVTGERGPASERVSVAENALVFSYEHQVRIEAG